MAAASSRMCLRGSRYDSAFRHQAALAGNRRWSVINATLFSMNFAARSSAVRRCKLCFATTHSEADCALYETRDPDVGDRLRSFEKAVLTIAAPVGRPATTEGGRSWNPAGIICKNFNRSACNFIRCRYAHICANCRGDHPASRCSSRGLGGAAPYRRPPGRSI